MHRNSHQILLTRESFSFFYDRKKLWSQESVIFSIKFEFIEIKSLLHRLIIHTCKVIPTRSTRSEFFQLVSVYGDWCYNIHGYFSHDRNGAIFCCIGILFWTDYREIFRRKWICRRNEFLRAIFLIDRWNCDNSFLENIATCIICLVDDVQILCEEW